MAPLSAREQVRLLTGDTGSEPHLTDAQVDHFVDQHSILTDAGTVTNVYAAAAEGASAIAAKCAPDFRFMEDAQSFDRQQVFEHYDALSERLQRRAGGVSALMTLSGTVTLT